jgi:RimJ/RimL family protein N-acetyltransferase
MDAFETERLTAERLSTDHLSDLVALHLDPEVARYSAGVRSADQTRLYLETSLAHWDKHGFGLWALRTRDGAFAGRAGIRHVAVDGTPDVEIAYTFRRAVWGQGLATEIASAMTALGLGPLRLHSLVAVIMTPHAASRRVVEKCGYHLERSVLHHGADCVVYRDGGLRAPFPA